MIKRRNNCYFASQFTIAFVNYDSSTFIQRKIKETLKNERTNLVQKINALKRCDRIKVTKQNK